MAWSPWSGCRRAADVPGRGPGTRRGTSLPRLLSRGRQGLAHLRGQLPGVTELLLQQAEGGEQFERLLRRLLVEALQGESDVHDGVLADLEVGQVLQAHLLDHTAEVDVGHPGAVP